MQSDTGLDSVTAAVRVFSTGRVHSERACTGGHSWDTKPMAVWRRAEAGAWLAVVTPGHTSLPLHPW